MPGPLKFLKVKYLVRKVKFTTDMETKSRVEEVIQTNAYFAHPENTLIAMLHDRRIEIRRLVLNHIKDSTSSKCQNLQTFEIPFLIFSANENYNMIGWSKCKITEPPMTMNMPFEELIDFVEEYQESDEPLFRW